MALPLRPHPAQRFIHQKAFYPNPTKMCRHLHCEAHWTRSAVEIQHGSSAQAFNAKPTGPDQPLRFSMAHPLRSFRPQRFIHQKLHAIRTKMLKHLHSEGHWTRSAVEVQHVSSPQATSPAALHPSEASRKSDKNV